MKIFNILAFVGISYLLLGCYRMPAEDEYSLVPTTNNPAVTYQKNDSLLPGVEY